MIKIIQYNKNGIFSLYPYAEKALSLFIVAMISRMGRLVATTYG